MFCIELILEQDHYYSRTKRMFCIEIIAILILILVLSKHSLCHYYRDYYYYRTKRMFCIEIIAILILILVLSKHSLCPIIPEQGLLLFQDKENVWIELILLQDYYYSMSKRMFCIEIIAILILILFLSKHSRCPRILEQGLLLFQDKENVLYRNNSNPYSDISSIQTFSLSWNTRTWITIILGQREFLDRTNTRTGITIILGQKECFAQK